METISIQTEQQFISTAQRLEYRGIEQGIEQGEKQKAVKVAKNLLKNGVDIAIIILSTGLIEEEINELTD